MKSSAALCFLLATTTWTFAQTEIPLWPEGAPGSEARRHEPAVARDYWIRNIHNPSITAFLPDKAKATGAAILICPGGGHRELVFNAEGVEPAKFLTNLGIAAFALKYRLARETNSPYALEVHARLDGQRALRMIRARASEWNIDPQRVGIMGFSAGGEVASMVSYATNINADAADESIEHQSARPDFQILIYPGPVGIPEKISSNAPPAFLLVANDDRGASKSVMHLLPKLREAGVPVELHLLSQGGHAFNMGTRSRFVSVKNWPQRLAEWLADNGISRTAPAELP